MKSKRLEIQKNFFIIYLNYQFLEKLKILKGKFFGIHIPEFN